MLIPRLSGLDSGRLPSPVFADDPRQVIACGVELRRARAEIGRVVRGARGVRRRFLALFYKVGLGRFFGLRGRLDEIQVAGVARQESEDLSVELGDTLDHRQVAAFAYKGDFGPVHAPGPHPDRLRVDDLIVFPGDDEEGNLYDPGLPGEPTAG